MEDARAVGIAAFLDSAPRDSLRGAIKKQPADFVVREISLDGHVLTLDTHTADRLPAQSERDAIVAAMEEARLSSSKQRAKEPLVFAEPLCGWREELRRLVGSDDTVAQLERVAIGEMDAEQPCTIEAPQEFRDRVYLQVCIQHCFPSVDCKLRKASGTINGSLAAESEVSSVEHQQIDVVQDGMYRKFRSAGISSENATALLAFIRKGAAHADAARGVELTHEDTKEARTALHRQISSTSSILKTRTETRAGKSCLVVGFSPHNTKKRKRGDQPPEPFVRFVLRKTNLEHFACFERLARALKRPANAFATAGTKDKVAITYQHVTIQGIAPKLLLELNRDLKGDDTSRSSFQVGHIEYAATPMALGNLAGNRFDIVVRDLSTDLSDVDIQARVDHVQRHGFINFFGFQRVGLPSSAVRPHQIGELIVAGKWEDAVKKIFTPSEFDPPECARAKAAFLANSADVDAVLKLIPPSSMQVERSVLTGLKRHGPRAWEAAIRSIAFARRTMYLHAYQSYLFNELASFRIKEYGTKVVEGDLVRESSESDKDPMVAVASAESAAQLNERLEDPLSCVVLPLPGSNVLYPVNNTGDYLKQLLNDHCTTAALKDSKELKGAYRALVERPRDVEWQRVDGDANAVRLEFSLSSGCFATMCLREILHFNL